MMDETANKNNKALLNSEAKIDETEAKIDEKRHFS